MSALFGRPLIAATIQELVDLLFARGLQHLASSLAHDHLEHVIWRGTGAVGDSTRPDTCG